MFYYKIFIGPGIWSFQSYGFIYSSHMHKIKEKKTITMKKNQIKNRQLQMIRHEIEIRVFVFNCLTNKDQIKCNKNI